MRFYIVLAAALAIALWFAPALADDEAMIIEAQGTAEQWLVGIDAGEYGACWDRAGAMLREKMSREDWQEALTQGREQLGAMEIRSLNRSKFQRDPDGAPAGTYVFLEYAVEYERHDVKELVVLRQEADSWVVVGYVLN